jgi:hypothetical protein
LNTAKAAGETVVDSGKALINSNPVEGVKDGVTTAAKGTAKTGSAAVSTVKDTAVEGTDTVVGAAKGVGNTGKTAVKGTAETAKATGETAASAAHAGMDAVKKPAAEKPAAEKSE